MRTEVSGLKAEFSKMRTEVSGLNTRMEAGREDDYKNRTDD